MLGSAFVVLACIFLPVLNGTASAQTFGAPTGHDQGQWSIGVYGGALTKRSFLSSFYNSDPQFTLSYIAAMSGSYVLHHFTALPADLELDATIAKRFGKDHEWDLSILPMVRWKSLPWNHVLYTNLRVGLLGASYVTGISPWERQRAGNDHGSRYLNFIAVELDFKPSETSQTEFFIRSHHRSGIFGLINNTHGGSTYITTGVRWHF